MGQVHFLVFLINVGKITTCIFWHIGKITWEIQLGQSFSVDTKFLMKMNLSIMKSKKTEEESEQSSLPAKSFPAKALPAKALPAKALPAKAFPAKAVAPPCSI